MGRHVAHTLATQITQLYLHLHGQILRPRLAAALMLWMSGWKVSLAKRMKARSKQDMIQQNLDEVSTIFVAKSVNLEISSVGDSE